MLDSKTLICPNCGHDEFSYRVEQVEYAGFEEYKDGRIYRTETRPGDTLRDLLREGGVHCDGCHNQFSKHDLVHEDSNEPKANR